MSSSGTTTPNFDGIANVLKTHAIEAPTLDQILRDINDIRSFVQLKGTAPNVLVRGCLFLPY